nr:MAG TPA: hypothetical protein [Caudoviricetes sp.]
MEQAHTQSEDRHTPHTTKAWPNARTICYKLQQQGHNVSPELHNVSPELLRKWVER